MFISLHTLVIIVNYSLANVSTTQKVYAFAGLCLLVAIILIAAESLFVREYFAWWGDRALEKAQPDEEAGFWEFAASHCYRLSDRDQEEAEINQIRSRQRKTSDPYVPLAWNHNPPDPELTWMITIVEWLFSSGRLLTVLVGLALFELAGFSFIDALGLTLVVYFAASLLADQIKYYYFYWPLRERTEPEVNATTFGERFVMTLRCYWISTILAVCIVWWGLLNGLPGLG